MHKSLLLYRTMDKIKSKIPLYGNESGSRVFPILPVLLWNTMPTLLQRQNV